MRKDPMRKDTVPKDTVPKDTMRVAISKDPFDALHVGKPWNRRGDWPCHWVALAHPPEAPFVAAYRCRFVVDKGTMMRLHVSADERYELFLDGERVGQGSERGDANGWCFETYDLTLGAGSHTLVARVWSLGPVAPYAQMSVRHGLIVAPQDDAQRVLVGTGVAPWQAKPLGGITFSDPLAAWGTGANVVIDGSRFDWGFEQGEGGGWTPVAVLHPGYSAATHNQVTHHEHLLTPATLPPMIDQPWPRGTIRHVADISTTEVHAIPIRVAEHRKDEAAAWAALLRGQPLTVAANTRRRVLIDLEDYLCAYPEVVTTGGTGSLVRLDWQEALFEEADAKHKGNRDEVEGKYFVTVWHHRDGIGDSFLPDGGAGRRFRPLWWQCGRYLQVVVETQHEPLTLERLSLRETRYPLEAESHFSASDPRLEQLFPIATRTLQMCAHETYMDCPYYEQLMYVGDTRLEALTTYVLSADDRLPKKAIALFDASRLTSGLTQSRYPSRVRQIIPPFSLWWVAMVHDYALWRDDAAFVRARLPGVRAVLEHYRALMGEDGLVQAPRGWNFADWVPAWPQGVPPDGNDGVSGVLNWQLALVLQQAAELETWFGDPELAARNTRLSRELSDAAQAAFWDEARGLMADDVAHNHYSEHSQCLALLGRRLGETQHRRVSQGLLEDPELARTTIYFRHYLFETYARLGRTELMWPGLALWFSLADLGFKTTLEQPEPSRSDCHAWGAHPIYHAFASTLGVRPRSPGFGTVTVAPQLGELTWAKGTLPHPTGEVTVDLRQERGYVTGRVTLPKGVSGMFRANGREVPLQPGEQAV